MQCVREGLWVIESDKRYKQLPVHCDQRHVTFDLPAAVRLACQLKLATDS